MQAQVELRPWLIAQELIYLLYKTTEMLQYGLTYMYTMRTSGYIRILNPKVRMSDLVQFDIPIGRTGHNALAKIATFFKFCMDKEDSYCGWTGACYHV